jgi:hypothetical protein
MANVRDEKNRNPGNYGKGHHSHSCSHDFQHEERLLPPRGDYQTLLSFQKAEVIYDITFRFAHKFLSKGDRTIDQMIQAARSGKKTSSKEAKPARPPKKLN